MRAALVQLTSSDDPVENLETTAASLRAAAENDAEFVLTPEVTTASRRVRRTSRRCCSQKRTIRPLPA